MPKKSEAQREVDANVRTWRQLATKRENERFQPLIDVRTRQRLERPGLIAELRRQGLTTRDARHAVDRTHWLERHKLEVEIAGAERKRIEDWQAEQDKLLHGKPPSWQPRWPRGAIALADRKSLAFWDREVHRRATDVEFTEWLETSRQPDLKRPADLPDFAELHALLAVRERIDRIFASSDTALQRRLQQVIAPVKVGRPRKKPDLGATEHKQLRGELAHLFKRVWLSDSVAGVELLARLRTLFPNVSREELQRLTTAAGRKGRRKDADPHEQGRPSAAAAYIIHKASGLPVSRIRAGTAPKPDVAKSPRKRRLVPVRDIDRHDHAQHHHSSVTDRARRKRVR